MHKSSKKSKIKLVQKEKPIKYKKLKRHIAFAVEIKKQTLKNLFVVC